MSAIFISHSNRDSAAAIELAGRLEAEGHRSIFLDVHPEHGSVPGLDWRRQLYAKLRSCRAVIVLCSEHWLASKWCFAELTIADSLGKAILPIKVAPIDIERTPFRQQILDFTFGGEETYTQLWRALKIAGLSAHDAFDWDGIRPPYPGLAAFQQEDAPIFFGRTSEIQLGLELLNGVRQFGGARLVLVLGASGCGKSSLVRAGLLPRLSRDTDHWLVVPPFRPRRSPFEELSVALSRAFRKVGTDLSHERIQHRIRSNSASGKASADALYQLTRQLLIDAGQSDARVLISIDQFEELLGFDASSSSDFVQFVHEATADKEGDVIFLSTLRSDFLADFQRHRVARDLKYETLNLGSITTSGLANVIEGPARVAGIEVETGLVQALVHDTSNQDALPLLAFTLRELYERYGADRKLEIREYEALGRLEGSVAHAASWVLRAHEVDPEETSQLRKAFRAMVDVNEDGYYARRPRRWSELPKAVYPLLERFVQARLLFSHGEGDDAIVEVAHDALFQSWDRLRGWLQEDREFLLWRKRLAASHDSWVRRKRHNANLIRGPDLQEAQRWWVRRKDEIDPGLRAYIEQCLAFDARRIKRRNLLLSTAAVLATLVAIVFSSLWQSTDQQRNLKTEALSRSNERDALRLIVEGRRPEALGRLAQAIRLNPNNLSARAHMISQMILLGKPIPNRPLYYSGIPNGVMFNSDGSRLLTVGANAEVWNTETGESIAKLEWQPTTVAASMDATGHRVLVVTADGYSVVWDVDAKRTIESRLQHQSRRWIPHFSYDGRFCLSSPKVNTAQVWDAETGIAVGQSMTHRGAIVSAEFSPDSRIVVTSSLDETVRVWDALTGEPVGTPIRHPGLSAAFLSPDGRRIATASLDRTVRLWDSRTGNATTRPLLHRGTVLQVSFSQDCRFLATTSREQGAQVWDTVTGTAVGIPLEHRVPYIAALFNPDGRRILTRVDDGVRVWDSATGQPVSPPLVHQDTILSALWSPDGRHIVTGSADQTARIWNAETGVLMREPIPHGSAVVWAAFTPDGRRIATMADLEGSPQVRFWDAMTGEAYSIPIQHEGAVFSVRFSSDGRKLLTVGSGAWIQDKPSAEELEPPLENAPPEGDQRDDESPKDKEYAVQLWDADSGESLGVILDHRTFIESATFTSDDKYIVTLGRDRRSRSWDATTGILLNVSEALQGAASAILSEDGRRALVVCKNGLVQALDAVTGQPVGPSLQYDGSPSNVGISPDGTRAVATWGSNTRLWDVSTGRILGSPVSLDGYVVSIHLLPNASKLVRITSDRVAHVWRLGVGEVAKTNVLHRGDISSVALSPDGRLAITGSIDRTAVVWSTETGGQVGPSWTHRDTVWSAVFSPDSRRVLTSSIEDGTAMVWSAETGEPIGAPLKRKSTVLATTFNNDGQRMATAAFDTVFVWDSPVFSNSDWNLLAVLAEAMGGYRVSDSGILQPIPPNERGETLQELRRIGWEGRHESGTVASFIDWVLTYPYPSTVTPFATVTLDRLLKMGTPSAIEEAKRAFPAHPQLIRYLREERTSGGAVKGAH